MSTRAPGRWLLLVAGALGGLVLSLVVWNGPDDGRTQDAVLALPPDPLALLRDDTALHRWTDPDALEERSILVVGDSLLKAAAPYLRATLADTGASDLTIAAMNGSTIGWAADQVVQQSGHDIVVIASGTNNLVDGWSTRDDRNTARAVQMMSTATCPVWIAPTAWRHPIEHGVRRTRVDATSLVGLLSLLDGIETPVQVADWDAVAPELGELHLADGIHHTGAGSAAYARFIAAAIVQDCTDTWPRQLVPSPD